MRVRHQDFVVETHDPVRQRSAVGSHWKKNSVRSFSHFRLPLIVHCWLYQKTFWSNCSQSKLTKLTISPDLDSFRCVDAAKASKAQALEDIIKWQPFCILKAFENLKLKKWGDTAVMSTRSQAFDHLKSWWKQQFFKKTSSDSCIRFLHFYSIRKLELSIE